MALPWVRLDSNIAGHDKILALVSSKSSHRWQAAASYMFSLGYAGAHETDGHVAFAALGFVHGTRKTAELLVDVGLWEMTPTGWKIHNYEDRQQTAFVAETKRQAASEGARKAACTRWHNPGCMCWKNGQTGPVPIRERMR